MTIKELYEYANEKGLLDYRIEVKYRDAGGDYEGADAYLYLDKDDKDKVILL